MQLEQLSSLSNR